MHLRRPPQVLALAARNSTTRALLLLVLSLVAVRGCGRGDPSGVAASPRGGGRVEVTALGRLEPRDGILRIAGPSRPSTVIARLLVEEGDAVEAEQPLAVLDAEAEDAARVARAGAELRNATTELARIDDIYRQHLAPETARDAAQLRVEVARADHQAAIAARALDTVRSPIRGRVLAIHARRGERVGPEGIAEVGETQAMYAVAEVYETEIGRVKVGQRATVRSPALEPPLGGTVERIGLKIGKLDVLGSDPAARADARVVEVRIRLDDAERAAGLSNLQVEVAIAP